MSHLFNYGKKKETFIRFISDRQNKSLAYVLFVFVFMFDVWCSSCLSNERHVFSFLLRDCICVTVCVSFRSFSSRSKCIKKRWANEMVRATNMWIDWNDTNYYACLMFFIRWIYWNTLTVYVQMFRSWTHWFPSFSFIYILKIEWIRFMCARCGNDFVKRNENNFQFCSVVPGTRYTVLTM